MKTETLRCPCGKTSEVPNTSNLGQQKAVTDFEPYMDQSNGLTHMWICSACDARVKKALGEIVEVFGVEKARYIYLSTKMPKPESKNAKKDPTAKP